MEAFGKAEKRKKPSPVELFEDVYDEIPKHLQKQKDSLKEHLSKNEGRYPIEFYEAWS
jgi:2-oxoisovalerate dehydrogenase E1 component alpha subunit